MKTALLAFITAIVTTYALTPLVMKLAKRFDVIDHPGDARRVHSVPTPRWGGLAIYVGVALSVVVVVAAHRLFLANSNVSFDKPFLGILLGGTVIALAGLIDDKYNLSPVVQIGGILAGGAILILFGNKIAYLSNPLGQGITLGWLAVPVTLLWVFGVSKAVDLMDGLDGLAAGICAIASATLLIMTFREVDTHWHAQHLGLIKSFVTVRIFSGALLGASLGFLRFNYPPAKIFMGTVGAQFMGFTIASVSIVGAFKVATIVAIAAPMLVLAVPIFDAAFVMVSRFLRGSKVTEADKSHVHHRLIERGLSHWQTIWVIYLMTAGCSAAGLALFWYLK